MLIWGGSEWTECDKLVAIGMPCYSIYKYYVILVKKDQVLLLYTRNQAIPWNDRYRNIEIYFLITVLWNTFTFGYPKLDITKGTDFFFFFLEVIDCIPALNIKAPENSGMMSMYNSIFRYLNMKSLAVISRLTYKSMQSCCGSAHPCFTQNPLCSVGIFLMVEWRQTSFMGILGMK